MYLSQILQKSYKMVQNPSYQKFQKMIFFGNWVNRKMCRYIKMNSSIINQF